MFFTVSEESSDPTQHVDLPLALRARGTGWFFVPLLADRRNGPVGQEAKPWLFSFGQWNIHPGGGFKYVLLSPLFGEDSHFDEHILQRG